MPTINKPPKKKRDYSSGEKERKDRQKVYATTRWKKLRDAKLMEKPICEMCQKELATQVHHINTFTHATNELEKLELAFDYNNLQSLCAKCHNMLHRLNKNNKDYKNK